MKNNILRIIYFCFIVFYCDSTAQQNNFYFRGGAIEEKENNKSIPWCDIELYQVKKEYQGKFSVFRKPEESIILKRIMTGIADKEGFYSGDLSLNSEYLIVFKKEGYYSSNYFFVTETKKNGFFSFLFKIPLKKRIAGEKDDEIKYVKRIAYFDYDKNSFVGKNEVIENPIKPKADSSIVKDKKGENKQDQLSNINKANTRVKNSASNIVLSDKGVSGLLQDRDTINKIDLDNLKQKKWIYEDEKKLFKLFEGEYIDNKKLGKWIKYYPNDTAEIEMKYINDQETGEYKLYYKNGIIQSSGNWDKQSKIFKGNFKLFNSNGNLIKYLDYNDNGKKSGKQLIYFPNGNIAVSASMNSDVLEGKTTIYQEDGKLNSIRVYKNGKLIKENIFAKNKIGEANNLLNQLNSPDTAVIIHITNYYKQLKEVESNYQIELEQRKKLLEEANLKISFQQKEIHLKNKKINDIQFQNFLQSSKLEKQRILLFSSLGILFLVFIILFGLTYNIREKSKTNKILSYQKNLIEQKNTEILDSIEYAKRIQTAILPPPRIVKEFLKNSFILYLPKDIVAGDFYWMESVDDKIYFAACDCTGHGVPGAMVSVVCNTALNRSLNEFGLRSTGEIFDQTRALVLDNFAKSDEEVQDGMDASLAALDVTTRKLMWSGANNPLWIYRKADKTIQEVKADKQPIGKGYNNTPFSSHELSLYEGDIIYLFTDGYADQFGGERGKKLTKAKFREKLLSIATLTMEEQRKELLNFHDSYRGVLAQVDDICVIGVKV